MAGDSPGNLLVTGPAGELAKDNASDHVNDDLPRAQIKRIVQRKLAALAGGTGTEAGAGASTSRPMTVSTDAVVAFTESATMFVTMLAAAASDVCSETDKKRQTINANDVFKALEELEMPDLNEPLKASLEGACQLTYDYNCRCETYQTQALTPKHQQLPGSLPQNMIDTCSLQERGGGKGEDEEAKGGGEYGSCSRSRSRSRNSGSGSATTTGGGCSRSHGGGARGLKVVQCIVWYMLQLVLPCLFSNCPQNRATKV